jgi:hypothetical protein
MELMMTQIMTEQKNTSITNTIQQFGKKLFGFVRGKVKSNEDAEDFVDEVKKTQTTDSRSLFTLFLLVVLMLNHAIRKQMIFYILMATTLIF